MPMQPRRRLFPLLLIVFQVMNIGEGPSDDVCFKLSLPLRPAELFISSSFSSSEYCCHSSSICSRLSALRCSRLADNVSKQKMQ